MVLVPASDSTDFDVSSDNFSDLEIRSGNEAAGFFYFYDRGRGRLIKHFLLEDRPQTAVLCQVTLIRRDDTFTPRIRLWIRDKRTASPGTSEISDTPGARQVKAAVDTKGCHQTFWRLVQWLQSVKELTLPENIFQVVDGAEANLIETMRRAPNRQALLEAVRAAVDGAITEQDITLLANRRERLEYFRKLLEEAGFFESELERLGVAPERLWQQFFEAEQWIFGYGLRLVALDSLAGGGLERITSGASVFAGAGKRIDAVMQSRGFAGSLLFCEIKRHDTPLLVAEPYRPPDVYRVSKELSGGVAQLQKTARKALRLLARQVEELYGDDGTPTGISFSTTRPRQIIVIGRLSEFGGEHGVNSEKLESFELFRGALFDVEVLTFDELYERARFIVQE